MILRFTHSSCSSSSMPICLDMFFNVPIESEISSSWSSCSTIMRFCIIDEFFTNWTCSGLSVWFSSLEYLVLLCAPPPPIFAVVKFSIKGCKRDRYILILNQIYSFQIVNKFEVISARWKKLEKSTMQNRKDNLAVQDAFKN